MFGVGDVCEIEFFIDPRISPLSCSVDVYQGPRDGRGPDQAGHVPEVWAQETLVCQGE